MPMMVHNPIDPDILYDSAENKDEPSDKNLLARHEGRDLSSLHRAGVMVDSILNDYF